MKKVKNIVPCEHCGKTLDLNQEGACSHCGKSSFDEPKKGKFDRVFDLISGKELFPKLNQHALDVLTSIDGLPDVGLVDVTHHPDTWEEFVQTWIQDRVVFKPDEVYEEQKGNGKITKYYPVHPKGSSNRPWMESRMMEDIKRLLKKNKHE